MVEVHGEVVLAEEIPWSWPFIKRNSQETSFSVEDGIEECGIELRLLKGNSGTNDRRCYRVYIMSIIDM